MSEFEHQFYLQLVDLIYEQINSRRVYSIWHEISSLSDDPSSVKFLRFKVEVLGLECRRGLSSHLRNSKIITETTIRLDGGKLQVTTSTYSVKIIGRCWHSYSLELAHPQSLNTLVDIVFNEKITDLTPQDILMGMISPQEEKRLI